MSETWTEQKIEAVITLIKQQMDLHLKAVAYLMTAPGAGLVGCFTLLKDYSATPQMKGIGFFISCFSFGLIFAMAAFVGWEAYYGKIMRMIVVRTPPFTMTDRQSWMIGAIAAIPIALSGTALFLALGVIIRRFGGL
jgi:hypothetical protein